MQVSAQLCSPDKFPWGKEFPLHIGENTGWSSVRISTGNLQVQNAEFNSLILNFMPF